MKLLVRLNKEKLIQPPKFLLSNTAYMTMMGSVAYGVNTDMSDIDVYGFCIPPKDRVFPHLSGVIKGFGDQGKGFDQWQQHHIIDPSSNKEYDFTIYSIVKYFQLCMQNNPNMIDSLFVPRRCVLHSTQLGEYVRENRKLFLHKGAYHKFKGYAFSQMSKMNSKVILDFIRFCDLYKLPLEIQEEDAVNYDLSPELMSKLHFLIKEIDKNGQRTKRMYDIQKYGYDLKFAYHLVRLLNECEQILVEHDLDLQKNREQLKSIRRGEWALEEVKDYFQMKEKALETQYAKSTLPHKPNERVLKELLLECLEMHYGSLEEVVRLPSSAEADLQRIAKIVSKYQ